MKTTKINDEAYQILYMLPLGKPKTDADTAIIRYSKPDSPAILMQAESGQWVITRKIKDAIFTDIDPVQRNQEFLSTPENSGEENGIDNKEEN